MPNIIYESFVTYLTVYLGNKLPSYYLGSSSYERVIKKNYRGSVKSKKYKKIWLSEIKNNPNLFEILIIKEFSDRTKASEYELKLQIEHDVVNNPLFINESLAKVNGFWGYDNAGENHPNWNTSRKPETIAKMKVAQLGINHPSFKGYYHTPFGVFASSYEIYKYTDLLHHGTLIPWCKDPERKITKNMLCKSKYLQSLPESPLDKTFRELGFWFELIVQ